LSEQREQLERTLSRKSADFRNRQEQITPSLARLQDALPPDGILIDFLEYDHSVPAQGSRERHLVAFVVRCGQPLERVHLGPMAPIAEAVTCWRQCFGVHQPGKGKDPAMEIRRLVWERLPKHIQEAKIVLLSPDGALSDFPWAALPGKGPGTYLLEEQA